jgi:broad specificity phosphatase PhoE
MLEAEPCDCAAAFVHNGVMNCMLQIVLGGEYDRTGVKTGNCGINVFEYENGKWKLLAWNYMGKL